MEKLFVVIVVVLGLVSCKGKDSDKLTGKNFQVSGVITNNTAKMIFLEEIPMTTMQARVVDSVVLGKEGRFTMKTDSTESRVYTLRLDRNIYPLAAVINDVPAITIGAIMGKENLQGTGNYEVKGSPASRQLKEFMMAWDTVMKATQNDTLRRGTKIKTLATVFIDQSDNPALTMYELAYYQVTANNPKSQIEPLTNDEVRTIVSKTAAKFPAHPGLASINSSLMGWLGQAAPEISLPDANGREVKLSSFRGKYVLVDFWASWCGPCRQENPNVVKAYNRFKDKNFTILGVSLDNPGEKDKWLKAVMKDNLTWTQVSDLKGWESAVVPVYKFGEAGIPYNVLVDPGGKIIAERLRGNELEAKLAEVLK